MFSISKCLGRAKAGAWFALVGGGVTLLMPSVSAASPDWKSLVQEAKIAESQCDVARALELYRKADRLQPNDPEIIHGISKQISDSIDDAKSSEQKELATEALLESQHALGAAPKNPVYILSLAVCYARFAGIGDNASRIEASRAVKRYADEALALDPKYAWAHHVLGQWNQEMARLGGTKRTFARLFYGGLPDASFTEALDQLKQAVALEPTSSSHQLQLGFAYWDSGDKVAAIDAWKKGLSLPTREITDQRLKSKASAELEKLSALPKP